MLNFGALIAFMGVNFAAFLRYYVRAQEKEIDLSSATRTGLFSFAWRSG